MSGMGTALGVNNPTIVSAFQNTLLRQGLIVLAILGVLALGWNTMRALQLRRSIAASGVDGETGLRPLPTAVQRAIPEPAGRRLVRITFGLLWIFDGILQGQSAMPLGMPSQVVKPAAAGSPGWVQHLVAAGMTIWNNHPVTAAAAAVWIQIGIGLWLLVAPRGNWSRLGGLASVAWGLIVWIFGEAFGAIFAPGLSWMFGAPGGVVFYAIAGLLLALPERSWATPRLGRRVLAGMGTFFVAMAVLQAWPGRGFWQGQSPHSASQGVLAAMVSSMAGTPQPAVLASILSDFASFDAAHGWAVNLVVVVALGATGIALVTGRLHVVRVALAGAVVLCLADWVLVQDFGFFGGVGTDPNSMVPMVVVLIGGYFALARLPAAAEPAITVLPTARDGRSLRVRLTANPTYAFRSLAALGAIGITVLGAAPMAVASVNPNADAIIAQGVDGAPEPTDRPAPGFSLIDQNGRTVTLQSLRGRALGLTFLDPVCTNDCPVIAQEFREADAMLKGDAHKVELIAVVANPLYRSTAVTRAFDRSEGLSQLRNWLYLTGSLTELESVWDNFGVQVSLETAGAMVAHSDLAYVIDAHGRMRAVLDADPGPATSASQSSFAGVLASAIEGILPTT